jgi:hypothetical protein
MTRTVRNELDQCPPSDPVTNNLVNNVTNGLYKLQIGTLIARTDICIFRQACQRVRPGLKREHDPQHKANL